MRKNGTAAKARQEKGARKAEQGNGNVAKAKGEKVQIGKKFLKKWDPSAAPSSDKFKRFKTNAFMKQHFEDALENGKPMKELAAEFKVTPARIWEMCHQLGINIGELKSRAKANQKKEA